MVATYYVKDRVNSGLRHFQSRRKAHVVKPHALAIYSKLLYRDPMPLNRKPDTIVSVYGNIYIYVYYNIMHLLLFTGF